MKLTKVYTLNRNSMRMDNKICFILYVFYSVFIIFAGLMRAALFTCHNKVPNEMPATVSMAITYMDILTGALTTKSFV